MAGLERICFSFPTLSSFHFVINLMKIFYFETHGGNFIDVCTNVCAIKVSCSKYLSTITS